MLKIYNHCKKKKNKLEKFGRKKKSQLEGYNKDNAILLDFQNRT